MPPLIINDHFRLFFYSEKDNNMKCSEEKIKEFTKRYVEEGDRLLDLIDSLIDEKIFAFRSPDHIFKACEIRKRCLEYINKLYSDMEKIGVGIVDRSVFRPVKFPEIYSGVTVKSYVSFEESDAILEKISRQIIETKKELRNLAEKKLELGTSTKKLNSIKIKFDETTPCIILGDKKIDIEADSHEFQICKYMFKIKPKEFCSWDEPFEDDEIELNINSKKMVRDTITRINRKIKKLVPTNDELLKLKKTSIYRQF